VVYYRAAAAQQRDRHVVLHLCRCVIRELSAAIMLFTSETKVVSVLIFDLNESGDLGAIAMLGLLILVLTFTVVVLINRIPGFGGIRLRNN
jgi:iron(III) transport system permease protein